VQPLFQHGEPIRCLAGADLVTAVQTMQALCEREWVCVGWAQWVSTASESAPLESASRISFAVYSAWLATV